MMIAFVAAPTLSARAYDAFSPGKLGLGLGGNAYTSAGLNVSARYNLSDTLNVQGGLSFYDVGLGIGADLLLPISTLVDDDELGLRWYAGAGFGTVLASNASATWISGAVGLDLGFKSVPVNVALEYRPGFLLAGGGFFGDSWAGHLRWFFDI